jgi:hypothetical protein
MKSLQFAVPLLMLFMAAVASADSIPILRVTSADAGAGPNDSSGDNAELDLSGPGFKLSAFGGTASYGFVGDTFSLGESVGGFSMSWFDFRLTIGNTTYDPITVDLSAVSVDPIAALVSVPGGCVPATLNNDAGNFPIQLIANGAPFNLVIPRGTLCLTFDPVSDNPSLYQFSGANFFATSPVPEPGTLGLTISGLGVLFGVARKRLPTRRG